MINELMSWILVGVVAGLAVALVFPDTKKYIIGTISFGVLGSLLAGILLSLFRISVELYSYANIFALFLFLITFLLFYLVTDRIYN